MSAEAAGVARIASCPTTTFLKPAPAGISKGMSCGLCAEGGAAGAMLFVPNTQSRAASPHDRAGVKHATRAHGMAFVQ